MDTSLLEPGIISYNHLNDSYIIMIMTFDLFGDEKYQYTFRPEYLEVPGYPLQDGTTRIFLNTKGRNDDEVSQELIDFLHYVEDTTDKMSAKIPSERIQRIHKQVCRIRTNEQIGVKYMQAWEESAETIQRIVDAIQNHPDADAEDLYDLLYELWADESEE